MRFFLLAKSPSPADFSVSREGLLFFVYTFAFFWSPTEGLAAGGLIAEDLVAED